MSTTLVETETPGNDVWVTRVEENVLIEAQQADQTMRGFIDIELTPGQAIRLSRALVAAAAEALGVAV